MAYVGVNKAQNESSKFLIDEQANINAFGTVLNTASQVGQAIYNDIKTSQAQDLSRELSEKFQQVDQEVYTDKSIPPEKRKDILNERYTSLLDEAKANKKTLPGVFKMLSTNAKDRISSTIENWNTEDFQFALKAKDASTISMLDSFVTTNDIVSEAKTVGWIKDKDYTIAPKEEPIDFSEGFIGNEKQGVSAEENDNPLFDQDLHTLAYSDASEFDIRVAAITKGAKQLYPNNAEMQKLTIEQYTNKLRDTVPNQDLELNFSQAFSESDPSSWGSYSEFYKSYAKELDTIQYGGKAVTPEKKRELLTKLDTMWDGLNSRVDTAATEIYKNDIAPVIQDLRNKQAMNSNSIYTTEDVNKAFDSVLKDNPGMADFLIAERENHLTVARNNERIVKQRELKALIVEGEMKSDRYIELSKGFSPEEIAALGQNALREAEIFKGLSDHDNLELGYFTAEEVFDNEIKAIQSGKYSSLEQASTELRKLESKLGKDRVDLLITASNQFLGNKEVFNAARISNANNDLEISKNRGTLTKASITEAAEKYGITLEENPEFFNTWEAKSIAEAEQNALKMYNSLNFDNSITYSQVDSIAEKFGLSKESGLYKNMRDVADQNWNKHLDELAKTSRGFAAESVESSIESVNQKILSYQKGSASRSGALEYLASERDNLTEADYKEAYNSLNNEYMMKKASSDATFEDKILKPFDDEKQFVMPGDTDAKMIAAGLDPNDYTNDSDYLRMRDAEAINQHIANVDQYTDNQMFLELREYGFSSADIKELGFTVPDITFQHTIEWAMEHDGEKPLTQDEYAAQLANEASSKMIQGSLPSGRSLGELSSVNGLEKSIEKSAESVYNSVLEKAKGGARYDNPDTIRILEWKKYELEDKEYDALNFEMLMKGRITEDTYLDRIKEDISVYKSPEYLQKKEVIETFKKYIVEQTGFGLDKDGKKIPASGLLKDSVAENFEAAVLIEYEHAEKAANGAYVDPLPIAKNVFDTMMESQYDSIIINTLDIIQSDTMKMFGGLFGSSETDSNKALSKFMKGEMTLIDANKLVQLVSDPDSTKQNQLFGTESGGLGVWMSMYNNGSSAEDVGLKVAYDVARFLGYNPPKMDENFKKNIEKFYNELPSNTARAQLSQAMLVSKWTVDAMKFSDKAIDPEIVKALGGNKVPEIRDNHIIIDIGGTSFVYDPGEGKASESFYYFKPGNGAAVTLTSNKEVTENKRIGFENSMKDNLVMDQYGIGQKYADFNLIKKVGDKVSVNLPALEKQLNNIIEAKGSSLNRISQEYISALNAQALEWEDLTSTKKTLYTHVEYSVDTEALAKAAEDGSILTTPLNSFITYTLKTEGEPKQKQRIDPWLKDWWEIPENIEPNARMKSQQMKPEPSTRNRNARMKARGI